MNFDKPKVTIDLEEYQHLRDRVNGMNTDEYVIAAKKVVAALLNTKMDVAKVHDYLSKEGIIFSVSSNLYSTKVTYGIHYDQISISLIDKSK